MGIGVRKQIKIVPYTSAANAEGRNIEAEGTRVHLWAEVTNPSGFREYANGQSALGETKDFLVRYRFDMFPNVNWRLLYDGRRWTVTEVRRLDEKKFYYRLTASSKSDG